MPLANAGVNVPLFITSADKSALLEPNLVTVTVYVFVTLLCDVTTTVIVLVPTFKFIAADGVPLATVTLFTFTVAVASVTVGVTVMDDTALATDAV